MAVQAYLIAVCLSRVRYRRMALESRQSTLAQLSSLLAPSGLIAECRVLAMNMPLYLSLGNGSFVPDVAFQLWVSFFRL